jgi:hypothetical protein
VWERRAPPKPGKLEFARALRDQGRVVRTVGAQHERASPLVDRGLVIAKEVGTPKEGHPQLLAEVGFDPVLDVFDNDVQALSVFPDRDRAAGRHGLVFGALALVLEHDADTSGPASWKGRNVGATVEDGGTRRAQRAVDIADLDLDGRNEGFPAYGEIWTFVSSEDRWFPGASRG